MAFKINDMVTWVGKIDWELRSFHGEEYSTYKGSSYNSYLIKDEKNVLIDTVWQPFAKEFVSNLKKEIDLDKIDYIIVNHSESDHSGALPELMKEIPSIPIYCTKNGAKLLKAHYHEDWNFVEVKTGDTLEIGENKLIFVEARMLHWPDSMFTYLSGKNMLFSNDAFGQHYASELMYNDKVDSGELLQEAIKYYANILTPYSPLVIKKIEEILSFNLAVDMICPSHGIIWRENPLQIVDKYMEWAKNYRENQVTIIYDTMWNSTRRMAETIAEGIKKINKDVAIKIFNSSKNDKNDIITEVFKSKVILVGSSTINRGMLSSTALILEMIKGLGFKEKKAAAFGSYGWGGESVKLITEELSKAGFEIMNDGIREMWNPDDEALDRCRSFGENIGKSIK
ncbi:anaerobic nitric oxide reductase flavorubredoxin [Clostridium botulinum]|uniref:anaerobic nitric oxide reductase flavorubredoxin n=1 Tax=Clostridium botulinum TaxID=1491 RepID=UPI0001F84E2B|nr:anaerobic nitric oxide reductase flavorubredoxin [Clostridium botulinum]NFB18987.1 anaerobic nitric oxide reductase flavorubredoxin [Clostridium botulinum]NFB69190.1 anaerobic nitric oxide reductase flavorubredoxin [Clostridium botulinum]NFB99887.1 anaerobic nitric oxide reductase flavorubredoxin [Clostridium botulinum]NFC48851.1 anaerobic nitric oxide reductase flavorubredoxin [Clostridium botulinum]NFC60251.1 anaerobic nitric oxide reductase flavorubredoxin [Clostridium botulinum]